MITWKNCFKVGISALLFYLCIRFSENVFGFIGLIIGALAPVIIGGVIAYLVNLLMSFYERHYFPKLSHKKIVAKSRRAVCMPAAILTLLAIISLIFGLVIPELVECTKTFIKVIPGFIDKLLKNDFINRVFPEMIIDKLDSVNWQSFIEKGIGFVTQGIGGAVDVVFSTIMSIASGVVTGFLSVIFAIYLLVSKEKLLGQGQRLCEVYLTEKRYRRISYFFEVVNDCFRKYIVGQCIEAVILGVLCMLGMLALRLPYAAMIGALVGFSALIPVAGAYIGAGVGAVMILTVSPVKALIFLIFLIVLQQLEGNLIYPRVVGNSLGLPAFWVLLAITVGGGVMGIIGMLIGVPITSAIYRFIREDVNKREEASKPIPMPIAEDEKVKE
ncbi:MAG: AI-2E family transporter [Clostridia bacterium]|nr:AI-2E family transporter [Clostridia bacterium]